MSQMELRFAVAARLTAGIDEVGRGPLAGPVLAAAVILPEHDIPGIADSKRLCAPVRERMAGIVREQAIAWAIGRAEVDEIDRVNIREATFLAMRRAVEGLGVRPARALVDGRDCPPLGCPAEPVVGGDGVVAAIGAASILAKVVRDAEMIALDAEYPGYGFARHKGYGTPEHLAALVALGPCPLHRRSFRPVRAS